MIRFPQWSSKSRSWIHQLDFGAKLKSLVQACFSHLGWWGPQVSSSAQLVEGAWSETLVFRIYLGRLFHYSCGMPWARSWSSDFDLQCLLAGPIGPVFLWGWWEWNLGFQILLGVHYWRPHDGFSNARALENNSKIRGFNWIIQNSYGDGWVSKGAVKEIPWTTFWRSWILRAIPCNTRRFSKEFLRKRVAAHEFSKMCFYILSHW